MLRLPRPALRRLLSPGRPLFTNLRWLRTPGTLTGNALLALVGVAARRAGCLPRTAFELSKLQAPFWIRRGGVQAPARCRTRESKLVEELQLSHSAPLRPRAPSKSRNSKLTTYGITRASFGVRQLAAAFPAGSSLPAAGRQQAGQKQSGSKLPHSKMAGL